MADWFSQEKCFSESWGEAGEVVVKGAQKMNVTCELGILGYSTW